MGTTAQLAAWHPSWAEPVELELTGSPAITFDEGWAPHVQATFECVIPDQATLDLLDPRKGVRVLVDAGYVYADERRDVHPFVDLQLDSRIVSRDDSADVLRLEASGDERTVQSWTVPLGASRAYPAGAVIADVIQDLLEWVGPYRIDELVNTLDRRYVLDEGLMVSSGETVWGLISSLADFAYGWVYYDGLGGWRIVDRPNYAARSGHLVKTGPNGTVTASTVELSRDNGYGNAVLLRYRDDRIGYAVVTSGDLAPVNGAPLVTYELDRTRLSASQESADSAAAAVLRRALSRGRSVTLDAVAALWLRPGATVAIQLPLGPLERALVARVSFYPRDGRMTLTTRQPFNATITTGA